MSLILERENIDLSPFFDRIKTRAFDLGQLRQFGTYLLEEIGDRFRSIENDPGTPKDTRVLYWIEKISIYDHFPIV